MFFDVSQPRRDLLEERITTGWFFKSPCYLFLKKNNKSQSSSSGDRRRYFVSEHSAWAILGMSLLVIRQRENPFRESENILAGGSPANTIQFSLNCQKFVPSQEIARKAPFPQYGKFACFTTYRELTMRRVLRLPAAANLWPCSKILMEETSEWKQFRWRLSFACCVPCLGLRSPCRSRCLHWCLHCLHNPEAVKVPPEL